MPDKAVNFLICYEHINREVENISLIKHELEKRGYTCEIIRFNGPGYYSYTRKKADVVVVPWLRYNENVYYYLQLAKSPYKIVNLQWEQVYSIQGIKSGLVDIGEQAKKAVHLCWGKNSRDRLIKSGVKENNVFITGAIQQDYGRDIFGDYYLTKEELAERFGLNSNKPWVLYVSSFAMANYSADAIDYLRSRFGEYIIKNQKLHKISQEKTLDWIEEFLKISNSEFIYRPHPSETVCERLNELKNMYSSFHVISESSVKQWAKVCDSVNLWISTSNAEIASLGIEYYIVRPVVVPEDLEVESMKGCEFITDLKRFIECNLNDKSIGNGMLSSNNTRLSYYYDYSSKEAAYQRVTDALEKVINNDEYSAEYSFTKKEINVFEKLVAKTKAITWLMETIKGKNMKWLLKILPAKKIVKENMAKKIAMDEKMHEVSNRIIRYIESYE